MRRREREWWIIGITGVALVWGGPAHAVILDSGAIHTIDAAHITAMPQPAPAGTGLGALDLVLLAAPGGGSLNNPAGPLNFDNANTELPAGVGSANESYLTSMGELRDFYRLNFPDGAGGSLVDRLALMAILRETEPTITLTELNFVIDYSIPSSAAAQDPAANDLSATIQNAVNSTYLTGTGTRIARLAAPVVLADVDAGSSGIDQVIDTGINPFDPAYADGTRVLVNWQSTGHDGTGETVLLSGDYKLHDLCSALEECLKLPSDPPPALPEPSSLWLIGIGLAGLAARARRRVA